MRTKISLKLVLAVGLVSITVFGIFSYTTTQAQHQALLVQIDHNASQLSETIKSSTKYDMLLNQRERIHAIIDSIGSQEYIHKIRIFNKDGEIIYSSHKEDVGDMVNKDTESCYACHAADQPLERLDIDERTRIFEDASGNQTFGIINPIYNEPTCSQGPCHVHPPGQRVLGVLDVTLSLSEVEAAVAENRSKQLWMALAAIAVIGLVLWLLVENLVGKPARKLVEATRHVAEGDLDYRIPNPSKDELGVLAESFNHMTKELDEAQRKVYHYDKLASVGRLAAGVAHEINNPLTGVLTYSSFLLKRVGDDAEARSDLEVIVRETKRCRGIVKGLLDFARQAPPKKSPVDMNALINQVLGILENQLSLNAITVDKDLAQDLPTVAADSNQLEQVLINLLSNASDAIGPGGGEFKLATATSVENGQT